jgi:hypothetical protein
VLFRDLYKLQVFFGSATGLPAIIDLTLPLNGDHGFSIVSNEIEEESEEASIRLVSGYQSRIVDDITGDGVDDLLVVSISHASGSPTKVQILTGHTGLWKAEYALDDPDFANGTSFEATNVCGSVGAAGDLNADGM